MVRRRRWLLMIVLLWSGFVQGQQILSRNITLDVNRQRLDNVLEILSNKGNFYFSYSSGIVKKDSLVSFNAKNKTVREILAMLFNETFEFRESGNYLIIRKAPIRMTIVTNKAVTEDRIYFVNGYVYDEQSGIAIPEASVYEKKLLAAALTDQQGYFKLKLKSSKSSTATLTISKEFYEDTSIVIEPRHNQQITITMMPLEREADRVVITPEDYLQADTVRPAVDTASSITVFSAADSAKVERTAMGKFLLSTKQKIQSINLRKFFTTRPFQVSFVPWVGTHGKMSGQVVNNFSLNILGGYTAGTNGVEIGGVFNIDKKEVKFFQAAGVFNVVGGQVRGFQVAGVNNTVLDTVRAFQAAGVNNVVKGKFHGFQVGGVYNHVTDSLKGVQVAGVGNFIRKKATGVQIAGVVNFSNKEIKGAQISGVINYTKKLKGFQLGLINIADSSEGFSVGLINIILNGYHKLGISSNEVMNVNAAFKTGNSKFYSILQAGLNYKENEKLYGFGYGIGSDIPLNKKKRIFFNPELNSSYLYAGSWHYHNILNRLQLHLNVRLAKLFSIYAGPAYSVFISDQPAVISGYKYPVPSAGYNTHRFSNRVTGWLGWSVGINLF